jgi:hypothetical protein
MNKRTLLCLVLAATAIALQAQDLPDLPCDGVIVSDGVRVRSKPDLSGSVIGKLNIGSSVKALAKSDQPVALSGEKEKYWWFKIGFGKNSEGWVYGAFLFLAVDNPNASPVTFTLPVAWFTLSYFRDTLYDEQGDADHRTLPAFWNDEDGVVLLRIPDDLAKAARTEKNPDHLFFLNSGPWGTQLVTAAEPTGPDDGFVLYVHESTNGGDMGGVGLTCGYNSKAKEFFVQSVRNAVSEDLNSEEGGQ